VEGMCEGGRHVEGEGGKAKPCVEVRGRMDGSHTMDGRMNYPEPDLHHGPDGVLSGKRSSL